MHEVVMPKVSETDQEAVVARWCKDEGDEVSRGEVLLEITTDKVTLEIESPWSGILRRIVAPEGALVSAEQVIAYVGESDQAVPETPCLPGPIPEPEQVARGVEVPSSMRRLIAERTVASKQTIPHYYLVMKADVTDVTPLRRELYRHHEVRIGVNDFLLAACAKALVVMPEVNRRWTDDGIESFDSIDLGLAVALDGGLVLPVVRNVDKLTVPEIARLTRALVQKARSKRLFPDDCRGGALSLTNLGMYGIDFFIPIIYPGQTMILGAGQVAEEPVVHLGEVAVRRMMKLTLSCDHRVIDGAVGARFLEKICTFMEHPDRLPLDYERGEAPAGSLPKA